VLQKYQPLARFFGNSLSTGMPVGISDTEEIVVGREEIFVGMKDSKKRKFPKDYDPKGIGEKSEAMIMAALLRAD
jgi:hypothetical protein